MFIYTVKASSLKFFAILLASVISLAALIAIIPEYGSTGDVAVISVDYTDMKTNEDRVKFINDFGYEVEKDSYITENVTIPESFDSAYEKYNEIQRSQGLNLKKYKGKNATRYSYYVKNYDGYDGRVIFTLLIYKNRVIGGDVTGIDANGFVHGFEKD